MKSRNARLVGGALASIGLLSSLLVSPVFADTKSNYASVYEQEYYEEYNDGAPVLAAEPFYFDVDLGVTYSNYSGSGHQCYGDGRWRTGHGLWCALRWRFC